MTMKILPACNPETMSNIKENEQNRPAGVLKWVLMYIKCILNDGLINQSLIN